ncbi:MAG: tRNA pseudouridine(38-40) synthase TruA [Vicingus serpentipes]|nr:tRNA pseudouridine(38-40) synthase TruA [Vicingus serpentipes]
MKRYFIEIAYNGANYHGWQIQNNANSIQKEINNALSTILQKDIMVCGAGRTDTGVHAKQLFAHFDTDTKLDLKKILFKLNSILPNDISCQNIFIVSPAAHARFSATARTYEYRITQQKNPFLKDVAYYFPHKLDVVAMNQAAEEIMKYTDFSCFSKSKTDSFTNDCTIKKAIWKEVDNQLIFTITANRFLRNMVRAIVGTLLNVGQHKIELNDIPKIINSKNRSNAGRSVPANGLTLTKITYPKGITNV